MSRIVTTILLCVPLALALSAQEAKITLRGRQMAPVTFDHNAHMALDAGCTSCHHPSKPEKPASDEYQKCESCHGNRAIPPMKTNWSSAFHNVTATKGVCIDCHRREKQTEKKNAPLQCKQCHAG